MNLEGLILPEKVSLPKLKSWIMAWTGLSPWLLAECQKFAGSLNEALALSLGVPVGDAMSEGELAAGFAAWPGLSPSEREQWILRVLLSMEVGERRDFMRFLGGRSVGVGGEGSVTGLAAETISLRVCAVLLYVKPMGRVRVEYECTFGLLVGGEDFVGCFRAMMSEGPAMDWIGENLGERVGPIRGVRVSELFELDCKGVQESRRHKAGFKAERVSVVGWLRDQSGMFGEVTRLDTVRGSLPRPQGFGQSD